MKKLGEELALLSEPPFVSIDRMLVKYLEDEWGERNRWVLIAAALCNLAVREGHTFLDLGQVPHLGSTTIRSWPAIDEWKHMLGGCTAVREEGTENCTPLVLVNKTKLYLDKYYQYESRLADRIKSLCSEPDLTEGDVVERAVANRFFVITGGPGTGKTTIALRYLDRLLDRWTEKRPPRFAAVAPTGKAAARLAESMSSGVRRLSFDSEREKALLSIPNLTIHRLLGALPNRSTFRHHKGGPIRYDALVVDESSMIDLPLMSKLLDALPTSCRLLFLGDKDQLTSVDVGSVLGDILAASLQPDSPLSPLVERLQKTYRFSEDSGIYAACQAARVGDVGTFQNILEKGLDDFSFIETPIESSKIPTEALRLGYGQWESLYQCSTVDDALAKLNRFVTLIATRKGPEGSEAFNRKLASHIRERLKMDPMGTDPVSASPIIVLENDYELELYNGDLGLVWQADDGSLAAYFVAANGATRRFRLSEMPSFEPAHALTIHKSQGSEFDEISCIFPGKSNRQITRELVYTAFSRAKKRVTVFSSTKTLTDAVANQAARATRLAVLLA
ncbi:exodeoxyribonuclease V subunit alpha [Pelagicoccus albus]|uniref:Exodeoxyribonuclease V subunit alpha n=1 Tax=Pelagicoccus albus TaxID=415222 RepID=A0A7X1E978_9BACT|nr:exodeoxyribonuclease V subunit alpha [Pelagicoccus albus]MBC2607550.1 exodeoxyribonuclease V subunit alpha [Pelagicoccus albus]